MSSNGTELRARGRSTQITGGPGKPSGLENGYFVKLTIFANVCHAMLLTREEIFGLVLVILSYDDVEGAARIANDMLAG